jgi:anti-sigma B factor antagonist
MEINRISEGNITMLSLKENLLGEKDSEPILKVIENSIENGSTKFTVDLEALQYINSTGLSVLLTILTKSRNSGGNMCIFNVPDQLQKLLTMTQLDKVFPKADSLEEAKNSL